MSALDELLDPGALAGLLGLASAAAGGAAIGLIDREDRLLAGRSAGAIPPRRYPVTHDGRVVGAVISGGAIAPELLVLVARAVELALTGAQDQADRARVANELAIGRRIQLALLPRRFPDVDGWTFAADYEPAREIGGDLFDAFPLRGRTDRFGLVIADVTGKGIPAALLMADVRALLHAAADNADAPADALGRVNRILVHERPTSLFVTASLLLVEAATGQVRYASAGHEPPLVARCDGRLDALEATGPILGAFADGDFEERTARLEPGDALVLYTDGVTEARDTARRFFGEERLRAAITGACGRPAGEIVRAVMDDVRAFQGDAEPFDDLTLLVVERRPTSRSA
jgi:sigma-B regulation protein RsbU (phosphoserine phosphatase)